MKEIRIDKSHKWCNKVIGELDLKKNRLIVMIKRGEEIIIPRGDTKILEEDVSKCAVSNGFLCFIFVTACQA